MGTQIHLQNSKTNNNSTTKLCTGSVYIWVVNLCFEFHLRMLERILGTKITQKKKLSSLVWTSSRSTHNNTPNQQLRLVLQFNLCVGQRILLQLLQLCCDSLQSSWVLCLLH